ncbi:MAG TPA: hypothetical protein VLX92_30400 [Kofleriaceae bacterium]|nr:hypothetical protein [Kofleriaceae bacterium]
MIRFLVIAIALAGCSGGGAAQATSPSKLDARPQPADPVASPPGRRSCTRVSDCESGENCFAPDFTPGRGAAPECQSDGDCARREGPAYVCGGDTCVPACKDDASCGPAMACRARHCRQLPCTDPKAARCPMNMRCAPSGDCVRMTCTAPAQCDTGVCWNGQCFAHGGTCAPASYCCPP